MKNKNNSTGAILLAGGRSSRMGKDKGFLQFGPELLLERILRIVDPFVDEIAIVLAHSMEVPKFDSPCSDKIIWTRDRVPFHGPLQGIVEGMEVLSEKPEKVFVLTCDLPYLSETWLQTLLKQFDESVSMVVSRQNDFPNPLLALYQRNELERAAKLLDQGESKARLLIKDRKVHYISPEQNSSIPSPIQDVNDPKSYDEALRYFGYYPS